MNTRVLNIKSHGASSLASFPFRRGRGGRRPGWGRAAFTLIELLVVIAITVILFALLLRPLVESLRLTQSAQVQAAAQDAARTTLERITRDLGSAVFVYDNASHPFTFTTPPVAGTNYDKSTNFLDLEVTKSDGTYSVGHAYNAKLDIVSARHAGDPTLVDPTTGEPIQLKPGIGSATISNTGLLFPLAPGGTLKRIFVGLKRPVDYSQSPAVAGHYSNSNEGLLAAASSTEDNTYILYEADVQPYVLDPTTKKYTINTQLFAVKSVTDPATGKTINTPELDDPDFFRYVTTGDVNWLDDTHANFPTQTADTNQPVSVLTGSPQEHNIRVDNWVKVAKAIITAPDIDLLALPHNPDGSIAYDTSGQFNNVAHSGVVTDPVTGTVYPIVNTTVTFRPALVEGDVAPATTTDYSSAGIPANAADNGGLPYIPTVYTAQSKSWGFPPHIDLYPQGMTSTSGVSYYTTDTINTVPTSLPPGVTVNVGDLVEEYHLNGAATGTPVYDVTTGVALAQNYVPMAVNLETGTINFDTPAFPAPPSVGNTTGYSPYMRFWTADAADLNNGALVCCDGGTKGLIDLKNLNADATGILTTTGGTNNSPLSNLGLTNAAAGTGPLATPNAVVVPGSVRVYGPDATPGPDLGSRVLYTPVSPGTPLSYNEYRVDYLNGLIQLNADNSNQLPTNDANGQPNAAPVQVAFDYQANLSPLDSTLAISPTNPASPLSVKVDYQTRDLLQINIGVRIYDSGQGRSITIPVSNQVQIGNSNR